MGPLLRPLTFDYLLNLMYVSWSGGSRVVSCQEIGSIKFLCYDGCPNFTSWTALDFQTRLCTVELIFKMCLLLLYLHLSCTIKVMKPRNIRWVGHVAVMGCHEYKILGSKNRPSGRFRSRYTVDIKVSIKEVLCVCGQDLCGLRAVVKIMMFLSFP